MSRRMRVGLVVVAGLGVVVMLGQVLLPGTKASPSNASVRAARAVTSASVGVPAPSADPATGPVGPTTVVAGVPMGFRHDAGGARAAAASFAKAYGLLVALDAPAAVAAKRAMAASAAADQLVAAMQARLATLRQVWAVGDVSYRVAPLAVRVRMDGAEAADADVWYVGVVAGRGLPTYEEWITQSYRLVWERDDWRIAAESESQGPRPDPGRQSPASAAELEARLAGFEAIP